MSRKIPFTALRRISLVFGLAALTAALLASSASAMELERLIAPPSVCPNQTDPTEPVEAQVQAMSCMTNFARHAQGLGSLNGTAELNNSAEHKSMDILRCDSFSHQACGRQFTYWMQKVGYLDTPCWRAGENIAWGTGNLGSVRSIFRAWIYSPGHRENILGPFGQIGIGMKVGSVEGYPGAHVWTQEFGSHC